MPKLIYITTPTQKETKRIAKTLLREKLAACCNIFPIESIYRWQGKIKDEREFGIFVKTNSKLVEKVIKKVKELHSFETPCIISFGIEKGYKKFLKWIDKETRQN